MKDVRARSDFETADYGFVGRARLTLGVRSAAARSAFSRGAARLGATRELSTSDKGRSFWSWAAARRRTTRSPRAVRCT